MGTLYGYKIYLQRERQFCLFTGEVFLGPKERTGRRQTFTLLVYDGNKLINEKTRSTVAIIISDRPCDGH